ncbi:MAG: sugar ABC transporter permease [Treponema sp.]|nr:sugar ABC transporter permease [Treponema sp.]
MSDKKITKAPAEKPLKAGKKEKHKTVQYDRWGYFFIAPFFLIYVIFSLIPLVTTFFYGFFEYYRQGLNWIGPKFVGFQNYAAIFNADDNIAKYFLNTIIMWAIGFIPQILVSLMLAVWFTNTELKLKAQQFFKTVIYMPNLIMASAFAMLFFTLFSPNGPIELLIQRAGLRAAGDPIRFFTHAGWTRVLVGVMNFMMWYGNTTILLMAGIMGIDNSLFEAARIDGASPMQTFFKVTIPLLMPIFVYVMITSLIGGIQMFDVPQILTKGSGAPNRTTMTIIMKLNNYLTISRNYGRAGSMSVLIFAVTGVLSGLVYKMTMAQYKNK